MLIGTSILSIHPTIQASNPRAGLAQASIVAIYCTYLTLSAVGMEPDDHQCNPLIRARGTRRATVIIGAIVTFITVAYTTTRAATYGLALGAQGNAHGGNGYNAIAADDYEHGLVTQQPSSRRELRQAALRAAIESGSLPASVLDDSDSDSSDSEDSPSSSSNRKSKHKGDDERSGTQYNYTLFHVIFFLSTAWVATLLTMSFDEKAVNEDFAPVGRTYWASWAKIVSAWCCYGVFGWSLIAPVVLPERFEY